MVVIYTFKARRKRLRDLNLIITILVYNTRTIKYNAMGCFVAYFFLYFIEYPETLFNNKQINI